jgi:hypothetical protein
LEEKEMRKETISISERSLMFCIAGQLYDQAPARLPRKADTIMQKVREKIRSEFFNDNEYYSLRIGSDDLYKYVEKLLKDIPEFRDLNLTQIEFENGISVDDENRPKYHFTSRYDIETSESWKTDFIDLDAFIRNVVNRIWLIQEADQDCFCCIRDGQSNNDLCKSCIVNPDFKYHFEGCRRPKGNHKFACKFDCFRSYYICCEECKDNSCQYKCDGSSETCENAVNRI